MLPDKADAARQAGALKAAPGVRARFFFAWAPLAMVEGGLAARSMEAGGCDVGGGGGGGVAAWAGVGGHRGLLVVMCVLW